MRNKIKELKKNFQLIFHLAWSEIKARYAHSSIGPFWLVLTTAISVLGLGYVWSILFNQDRTTFIPSLTIGLVIWQFISTCLIEAPTCFNIYSTIMRNYSYPTWIYPTTLVIKNFIIFLHNLIIVGVVLILFPQNLGFANFLIFPSLLLLMILLCQISIVLAFLGAKFKDLSSAINAFMPILFFLSPVLFKPNQLGVKENLMWFNPLTYLITIIRDPITGNLSELRIYLMTTIFIFITSYISNYFANKYRYKVLYWI